MNSRTSVIISCENELSYFRNNFSPFEDGTEFIDLHHEYSYDLDIFGPESLFNRINRTVTLKGKEMLACYSQRERNAGQKTD